MSEDVLNPPPLRPCPFCGGGAILSEVTDGGFGIGYVVRCKDCRATTRQETSGHAVYEYRPRCFAPTDNLLAARHWNIRTGEGTSACPECGVAVPHTHGKTDDGKVLVLLSRAAQPPENEPTAGAQYDGAGHFVREAPMPGFKQPEGFASRSREGQYRSATGLSFTHAPDGSVTIKKHDYARAGAPLVFEQHLSAAEWESIIQTWQGRRGIWEG